MISLNAPYKENRGNQRNLNKVFKQVLKSRKYILGDFVENFEKSFASKFGAIGCVGVGNGTDAISLGLRAFEIGPGDEVITVGNTALATIAAIISVGATPVIVDVELHTGLISEERITDALSAKTRAIVLVHLFGSPVDVDRVRNLLPGHVRIIEDCAQAHGAKINNKFVGTMGDLGCFSFYPTKILGTIGDGGCVIGNDQLLMNKLRRLREYGWDEGRIANLETGINSRLDELHAAILENKLESFDSNFKHRTGIANYYQTKIHSPFIKFLSVNAGAQHAYHLFVGLIENRDEFLNYMLHQRQIEVGVHYRTTILDHKAYLSKVQISDGGIRNTEFLAKNIVSLPMNNYIKRKDLNKICAAVNEWQPR
jgi:dTDP-4-amino-4,6-dideoxygalactose transaminase